MTFDNTASETNSGSIFIEIELQLTSESGRAKHLDLNEQGSWLAERLWHDLQQAVAELDPQQVKVPQMKYWGTEIPSDTDPIRIYKTKR